MATIIMADITSALVSLYPTSKWKLNGYTYGGLTWQDPDTPKPTEEELIKKAGDLKVENAWKNLRKKRDLLLTQTDKYIVADYPHPDEATKQGWVDYRQALRNLPSETTDPENPVWPTHI